jgi:hypothetical protein
MKPARRRLPQPASQRGATLFVALVLLLLVSILAASSVRSSMAGLRSAVAEQLRAEALQKAQSLVDAVLGAPANTAVTAAAGDLNCLPNVPGCTRNSLQLVDAPEDPEAAGISVKVRRIEPRPGVLLAAPPRGTGYSAVKFQAAHFQVESRYDETSAGHGRAELSEGAVVIVPAPNG